MMPNVAAALTARGFLKNGTALLIASTPVNDDEPDEKALKINAIEIPGTTAPTVDAAWNGIAPEKIL
mgnify:CR=1 FL=1